MLLFQSLKQLLAASEWRKKPQQNQLFPSKEKNPEREKPQQNDNQKTNKPKNPLKQAKKTQPRTLNHKKL